MRRKAGFTLVEIMIVVAIIGLLAAIAIPSFLKARESARRNACINNLRQLDGAKDQYALEYGGSETSVFVLGQIGEYIKDTNKLFCPIAMGTARDVFTNSYSINMLTNDPTCAMSLTNDNHDLTYSGK